MYVQCRQCTDIQSSIHYRVKIIQISRQTDPAQSGPVETAWLFQPWLEQIFCSLGIWNNLSCMCMQTCNVAGASSHVECIQIVLAFSKFLAPLNLCDLPDESKWPPTNLHIFEARFKWEVKNNPSAALLESPPNFKQSDL